MRAVAGAGLRASSSSIRRQFDGSQPRLRERAHRLGAAQRSRRSARRARRGARGRGCTRTHARVMTPSVPSEPSSIRSGLGPAPEPGSRRDSQTPAGVIARTHSTRSSTCVRRVAKWPPARVAIQPPSVESSNDCGKKRIVSPCSPSSSSTRGPAAPAPMRAAREVSSSSSSASSAPRSSADRAVEALGDRAPRRRRRRSCRRRTGSPRRSRPPPTRAAASTSRSSRGRATTSGACS